MQNPFNKLSPAQVAFLSGLVGTILSVIDGLIKTGQPLTFAVALYAVASAVGGYLAKTAIPGGPAAKEPDQVPVPAEEGEGSK